MGLLQVSEISKNFGAVKVLNGVSFSLEQGEFGCLLGSSGSGKSTLLRMIAGLEIPDTGSISVSGQIVSDAKHFIKPEKRQIGMIFQDYALFPHLTVKQNILFGAVSKKNTSTMDQLVNVLGLRELLERYPHQVSGGQQQRVAIARSLMVEPQLLLMDEPFSNLDEWMKEEVRDELRDILRKLGATVLFVTHHAQDALSFADRIMIMDHGKIVQQGRAEQIIDEPVSARVAGIFGKVNRLSHDTFNRLFGLGLEAGNYFIKPDHFVRDEQGGAFKVIQSVYHGSHYDTNVVGGDIVLHLHLSEQVKEGDTIRVSPIKNRIYRESN